LWIAKEKKKKIYKYNKVCKWKYLSDAFPIQNGLKQGDTLLPLPSTFVSQYAIRQANKIQKELEMNGTH
jgi:hypothetical protein